MSCRGAEVADRLGPTLILAGAALALCTLFGLLAGVVAAVKQYGGEDKAIPLLVLIGISTPSFFLWIVLILWFSVGLGWFPTGGMCSLFDDGGVLELLHYLALPALTLAVVEALCDRVAVMQNGKIVEEGTRAEVFRHPAHDYTRLLLASVPVPGQGRRPCRGAASCTAAEPTAAVQGALGTSNGGTGMYLCSSPWAPPLQGMMIVQRSPSGSKERSTVPPSS